MCPAAPSGAAGLHIKPDLPCENENIVSKQTTTSRKGHQGVYRLTRPCLSRWKKHRTKYVYDLNGNLRTNGNQVLDFDDENQLIRVTVTNAWKDEFTYDGKFRRRIEKDFTWSGSAWTETNEIRFIYDGNSVIEERNSNNVPVVTYTRTGGSLLARSDHSLPPTPYYSVHSYYHTDGNGNVTMLINASQSVVAKYLYDSFGNTLSMSGPMASVNSYRFASKEWNGNIGFYYFGRRYYDPNLQRFANRDPLQENGGLNLYGYCGNDPVSLVDILGLCPPSVWDLFWLNIYENGLQNTTQYGVGLGLDALSLLEMQYQYQSNPGLFAYNALANQAGQLGVFSADPSAYANNLWNGFVNTATTSQGIGQITGGVELGIGTGGLLSALRGAAAEGTVGQDIVGTTFNAVRPTQDAINPDIVAQYVSDIRAGNQLEPISVGQQANGDLYILDGHHRFVAGQLEGVQVPQIITQGAPTGLPNWSSVSYQYFTPAP